MRFPWTPRALLALGLGLGAAPAAAQWSTAYEPFYLPAAHNWAFRKYYPQADRLFNAFDYGHAILYEELYTRPQGPVSRLEEKEFDFLTRRVLNHPPRLPLEEGAIEIAYAKLAPEAKAMFDWAHVLHRQLYDVLASESLSPAEKDAEIDRLVRYYRSQRQLAFSARPKSMELMDGQYYSLAFRERYPKFNGLIWAYHWLQVGLYEPLLLGDDVAARQTGVTAAVARFRQLIEDAPANMPHLMPMTAAIAPEFARRYPEAAIIFDNLHMMHDVVSDILASPEVPRGKKREEILRAARLFRDDTSYVTSVEEWRQMAVAMGVHNQGGPAVGIILTELPRPTAPRGMSMAGAEHAGMQQGATPTGQHAGMPSMQHGGGAGAAQPQAAQAHPHGQAPTRAPEPMQGMQHAPVPAQQADPHAGHGIAPAGQLAAQAGAGHAGTSMDTSAMRRLMEMHQRMLADPVIRERVATDPVLQRMLRELPQLQPTTPGGHAMPGMGAGADAAERAQALEFIVRLLAKPEVQARIHADPELHRLWQDPAVQARLRELRTTEPRPAATPSPHH